MFDKEIINLLLEIAYERCDGINRIECAYILGTLDAIGATTEELEKIVTKK